MTLAEQIAAQMAGQDVVADARVTVASGDSLKTKSGSGSSL